MSGDDLADRVAGEQVWLEPHGLEETVQRQLGGEEGGLGVGGVIEELRLLGIGLAEDQLLEGAVDVFVDLGAGLIQRLGVSRVGLVELLAHPRSL